MLDRRLGINVETQSAVSDVEREHLQILWEGMCNFFFTREGAVINSATVTPIGWTGTDPKMWRERLMAKVTYPTDSYVG